MVQDTKACQAAFDLDRDVPTCTGARDGTCLSARAEDRDRASVFAGATDEHRHAVLLELAVRRRHRQRRTRRSGSSPRRRRSTRARSRSSGRCRRRIRPTLQRPGLRADRQHRHDAARRSRPPNAHLHRDGAVVHDAAEPDQPVGAEEPRREDDGLSRHQRPDLLERRHDGLVRGAARRPTAATPANFARFFRVPGMTTAPAGPATDQFDMLTPLVDWVEHGQAPDSVARQRARPRQRRRRQRRRAGRPGRRTARGRSAPTRRSRATAAAAASSSRRASPVNGRERKNRGPAAGRALARVRADQPRSPSSM